MSRISAFTKATGLAFRDALLFLLFCVTMFALVHFIAFLIGALAFIGIICLIGLVLFIRQVLKRYQKIMYVEPKGQWPSHVIV